MKKILAHKAVQSAKSYVLAHKVISSVALIVLLYAGYWGYGKLTSTAQETRYVLSEAQKGTIISSVTGSGQVSASNQIELKSKASGDVVYLGVVSGQTVRAGALVAQLDATSAQKAVRDAEVNLESAKITLEKLKGPDGLSVPKNKEQAQEDLAKAYDDGFNTVANAFLDLPSIMSGLQEIIINDSIVRSQWNADYFANTVSQYDDQVNVFRDEALAKYKDARTRYDKSFLNYKSANRFSDEATLEVLVSETYDTTVSAAEAVKSAINLIQSYEDKLTEKNLKPVVQADTYLTQLGGYTGKTNSHLLNLLSVSTSIKNAKDSVLNADLDVRSQELSLKQRENALLDAKENLVNYFVRAPFSGTIAKVGVKKLDSVSSGTSIATLITKQKIAEIPFNEVDVAKIKMGQKVNLTFDAVEGLTISGQVVEIDTIGTVTQGVVNYNVKIGFDTQDERVKSGMSVSAVIITGVKQDVIVVSSSAVKTQGNNSYVEIFDPKLEQASSTGNGNQGLPAQAGVPSAVAPKQQSVEVGISNDTQTEIVSGLKEGAQIVVRTISASSATTAAAPSLFGGGGSNKSIMGR